jgi:hypothetical protein
MRTLEKAYRSVTARSGEPAPANDPAGRHRRRQATQHDEPFPFCRPLGNA